MLKLRPELSLISWFKDDDSLLLKANTFYATKWYTGGKSLEEKKEAYKELAESA